MAAPAWIVPGPTSGPLEELTTPNFGVPKLSLMGSPARRAWAFLPAALFGFVLGVALALAQAPPSSVPKVRIGAPPPASTPRTVRLPPRHSKPLRPSEMFGHR